LFLIDADLGFYHFIIMTLLLNQAYSQFAIPKELQLFDNNPNQLVAQNQYYSVIKPKSASIQAILVSDWLIF
jgi:glycyl-tRNA synthetase alpha subunit